MGARGPKPLPTAIRQARGTHRADERPNNEPRPATGRPRCPDWLRSSARSIWRALVPDLEAQGTLARIDGRMLARYCEMAARWIAASRVLQKDGETYEAVTVQNTVRIYERPEVKIVAQLDGSMQKIEAAFGMSPSARTRIEATVPEEKVDDEKGKFFPRVVAG